MDNFELANKVNTSLYYMLSSLNENSPWPTGPGGLATNGYWGNGFWDNDMWSMISVLPWWPQLSKTGITYRYQRMGEAAKYAEKHNSKGLYFPW
jgi:trehalose/maltose hydrolase-like predicted phosphorylase|tara:strand:- start:158 stop:439 length:282 start_codon:yes stop_codon:yes gene_type:complete